MGLSDEAKKVEVFDVFWRAPRMMSVAEAMKLTEEKAREGFWVIIDGQMFNNMDEIRNAIKNSNKVAFMVPVGGG
jgi:hypothetical protein